ncbi:nucleotide exchange factor GrpE [Leadbettera azotonutricia]|uniref:Protein GrpE n=1 Tax=Leadbettera azotonutricia (strain ATCC BAA-888 / DSM 13862 / ZAS-9) TaxID=545695 RepID=F5Y8P3_LEAAZ|nr:nucleotide exchange factor GrpE [Leadbettera azotonutricia]AEF80333.1 co-chaperone GrpE [Leadbettera azotonutricia ZAS-9]
MSKHSHNPGPEEGVKKEEAAPQAEAGASGAANGADAPGGETGQAAAQDQGAVSGNAQAAPEKPLTPEERIAALEIQLAEANDQYLRKAADFENFRKRMAREKQEAIDFANQSLLMDLIQTMDDFDRAIKVAEGMAQSTPEFASFYEGVSMIEKRLSTQLDNKWGLKRFDSEGQPFDPNRHEAIMMEKSAEAKEATVAQDLIKGYTLKDRVIRAAKVKVIMPESN